MSLSVWSCQLSGVFVPAHRSLYILNLHFLLVLEILIIGAHDWCHRLLSVTRGISRFRWRPAMRASVFFNYGSKLWIMRAVSSMPFLWTLLLSLVKALKGLLV